MTSGAASEAARRRFVETVLPHLDDAYRFAHWLTGNRADAEDVVQEACLKAMASLESVLVAHPRAWLMTIVRHAAYSWIAKNRPATLELVDDPERLDALASRDETSPSPEESMIAAADQVALTQAIAALAPAFREVVVMRDLNGMSYREIAEAVGVSQGTVMSRLARGRAILIKHVGNRT
jgi:RNA polymerase sigma factor (sigma-70 family)